MKVELKGLSREQVTNLLPEALISLCWRGSVAHGMYVPKSDPDSIDDKDIMGIYIAERSIISDSVDATSTRNGKASGTASSTSCAKSL